MPCWYRFRAVRILLVKPFSNLWKRSPLGNFLNLSIDLFQLFLKKILFLFTCFLLHERMKSKHEV